MVSLELEPPPLSRRRSAPRAGPLRGLLSFLALAGALAAGFWLGRVTPRRAVEPAPAAPTATPTPTTAPTTTPTTAAAAATSAPTSNATPRKLSLALSGSLEDSISAALSREDRPLAEELTAVVNRLLVWDLQVSREGMRGDRVEILWTPPRPTAPGLPPTGEPVVEAVRYASSKLGAVLTAFRFQPEGARWARYYRADGSEVEARLVDAPIDDYEQVSSLLRDGRGHRGVDFKAPVGSPVRAPFDGVVVRRNWNFARNGNCLELRDPASGRRALFLHLESVPREMAAGRGVKKGEVVATSGNSGRSFAPHLHYQLEDAAGRVLDPFEVHETVRRGLAPPERAAFEVERARLVAVLGG